MQKALVQVSLSEPSYQSCYPAQADLISARLLKIRTIMENLASQQGKHGKFSRRKTIKPPQLRVIAQITRQIYHVECVLSYIPMSEWNIVKINSAKHILYRRQAASLVRTSKV